VRSWFKRNISTILNVLICLGIFILVVMFINNSTSTKQTAMNTNRIVKNQDQTLAAIRALSQETKNSSDSNGRHIDCIAELFAKFTRDGQPIDGLDLDHCKADSLSSPPSVTQNNTSQTIPNQNSNKPDQNQQPKVSQPQGGGEPNPSFVQQQVNRLEGIGRALGGMLGL
jgi:hypothetical protein